MVIYMYAGQLIFTTISSILKTGPVFHRIIECLGLEGTSKII